MISQEAPIIKLEEHGTSGSVLYEDARFGLFHLRVVVASIGGVFSDGFGLGIVGIALSAAAPQLALTAHWKGLIAAGSLTGLFVGAC